MGCAASSNGTATSETGVGARRTDNHHFGVGPEATEVERSDHNENRCSIHQLAPSSGSTIHDSSAGLSEDEGGSPPSFIADSPSGLQPLQKGTSLRVFTPMSRNARDCHRPLKSLVTRFKSRCEVNAPHFDAEREWPYLAPFNKHAFEALRQQWIRESGESSHSTTATSKFSCGALANESGNGDDTNNGANHTDFTLTVVFDIDETLVWADNKTGMMYPTIHVRPGAIPMLVSLAKRPDVEIILWSCGNQTYVTNVSATLTELVNAELHKEQQEERSTSDEKDIHLADNHGASSTTDDAAPPPPCSKLRGPLKSIAHCCIYKHPSWYHSINLQKSPSTARTREPSVDASPDEVDDDPATLPCADVSPALAPEDAPPSFVVDHVKDLRLLGRDLRRVLMVENDPQSCLVSRKQCVVIPPYEGPPQTASVPNGTAGRRVTAAQSPAEQTIVMERIAFTIDRLLSPKHGVLSEKRLAGGVSAVLKKMATTGVGAPLASKSLGSYDAVEFPGHPAAEVMLPPPAAQQQEEYSQRTPNDCCTSSDGLSTGRPSTGAPTTTGSGATTPSLSSAASTSCSSTDSSSTVGLDRSTMVATSSRKTPALQHATLEVSGRGSTCFRFDMIVTYLGGL